MSDVASLTSLGAVQITVALSGQIMDPVTLGNGLAGLSGFARFAGTGGTSITAYIQQSPDGGATWFDIYCAKFTADGVIAFSLVQGAGANLAATDGALADNTALNSGVVPLFDRYRLKYSSVGVWVNGLLAVYVMPRG